MTQTSRNVGFLCLHVVLFWNFLVVLYASVNSTFAQRPPPPLGLLQGICPPVLVRVVGICKFCTARGPGICQLRGHSQAFDMHAVSYQNITTQKVLLEKKQIGSSVKERNKMEEGCKGKFSILCMHFIAYQAINT